MHSEELFARSLKVAPGGVHSPVRAFRSVGGTPIFFQAANGAYLESVEKQKYIDFCMSFGPHLLGHRDPEIEEVVHRAVQTAWSFGTCEPYSLELAEWVCQKLPWVERLRFVTSGTEAVMSALRVARAATGRDLILKFEGCYHGHMDSLLVKAGSGLAGESASDSLGVSEHTARQTLTVPLDSEAEFDKVWDQFGDKVAAVILEPLPANYGLLQQRPEWLQHIEKRTREKGALLIFDEVISGFRVALGGMAERLKIKPDLVTFGKVIGGGFPVGAYGGRADLMGMVAPAGRVYQAGTLSANPIGMQAGLATLKKAEKNNLYAVLEKRTAAWAEDFNIFFKQKQIPMQVSSMASIFWFHPATDKPIRKVNDLPSKLSESYAHFFHQVLKKGVYLAPSGFEVGFISWAHSEEILREASDKIKESALVVF